MGEPSFCGEAAVALYAPVPSTHTPVGPAKRGSPPPLCPIHTTQPPRRRHSTLRHLKAYSYQLTAYREPAASRQMHPLSLRQLTLRESDSLRFVRRFAPTNRVRCHPGGRARYSSAAKPLIHLTPPMRSTHNPVGPAKRRPTYHLYAPSIRLAGIPNI